MTREEIEQTTEGILKDVVGKSNLLVSFGGIQQGLGIPVFEFFNALSDIDCDKVFLRDFEQAWYHKGVDYEINNPQNIVDFLKKISLQHTYNKVCFIGNSMGGYAAILFGTLLNVDNVIAFAPQTFIDKENRIKHSESRWSKQLAKVYASESSCEEYYDLNVCLSKNKGYKTQIGVFYSPLEAFDTIHANHIKNIQGVTLHCVKDGGHAVVKELRKQGKIKPLILSAFEG